MAWYRALGVLWFAVGITLAVASVLELASGVPDPLAGSIVIALGFVGCACAMVLAYSFLKARVSKGLEALCAGSFLLYAIAFVLLGGAGSGSVPTAITLAIGGFAALTLFLSMHDHAKS